MALEGRRGELRGIPYHEHDDGTVTATMDGGTHTWRTWAEFEASALSRDEKPEKQAPTRNGCAGGFLILALGGAAYLYWPSSPTFTDDDIASVKASIRSKYNEDKNTHVEDVALVRSSPNRLEGYVKVRLDKPAMTLTKTCTANKDEKSYVWRCQ